MHRIYLASLLVLFLFAGCLDDPQTAPEQDVATGTIIAEFVDAETSEPLVAEEFSVSVMPESTGEFVAIGLGETNEEGIIQVPVQSQTAEIITNVSFHYEGTNLDIDELNQSINLELRFEEPFDEEEIFFPIETDTE